MKQRSLLFRISVLAVTAAGLSAFTALESCSSDGPGLLGNGTVPGFDAASCQNGETGCPCDVEGQTTSCGEVIRRAGEYVTCSEGKRTCSGGKWGSCVGDSVYVKGAPISLGTLDLQSTPSQCANNPCDPGCTNYVDNGTGLDASGIATTDSGGIAIQPVDTGPACTNLQCQIVTCDGGGATTITGTVRDPAGNNPIYNANVYVPNGAVSAFTPGVSADQCGNNGLLTGNPIALTQTAANGTFTLTNVPSGNNIPLVIQIGRWRRQITIPTVTACTNTALTAAQTRLPKNQSEGDIPKIAIASGGCDPLECLLTRIGIDTTEFTVPSGTGRVGFYQGNGGMPLASGSTPWWDTLMTSQTEINKYDLVFLPCQCGSEYNGAPAGSHDILRTYAGAGGRIFTSHWGREWIENGGVNAVFPGVANWDGTFYGGADPMNVYADTSHSKGLAFSQWLTAAGATSPFSQTPTRFDVSSVIAPTLSMAYGWSDNNPGAHVGAPDNITDMTFNTPLGVPANQQVGRVVFADTHVSGSALRDWSYAFQFPTKCATGALTPQEKALEFLIFDLSACVGPQPVVTPPYPNPATFVRDYEGICPAGKGPVWHFFDWMTHTPGNSNIVFKVQTADTQGTLAAATLANLATVSGAPVLTWQGADVQTALDTLPSKSKAWLRVTITLNPTSDAMQTPVLDAWRQAYDCVDNQ